MFPDDPRIEDMDEFTWAWMYQSWYKDQEDSFKTNKDLALFLGHFFNPDMAQKIAKAEDPDFSSSDEDFEKATDVIRKVEQIQTQREQSGHRRRRRRVVNNLDK